LSQMAHLEEFLAKRRAIAANYQAELPRPKLEVLANRENRLSAWHLFVIKVPAERRKELFEQLRESEIGVNVHYMPIYKQPWYQREQQIFLLQAEHFYAGAITLPLFPGLGELEFTMIVSHLRPKASY
jgi:dTDP-4-amino-4,6-dideoxygalactose transaminase